MVQLEAAVVGPLGQAVFHHDHRRDDLGALQVGDVVTLDTQRRLGQPQRFLERDQRPGARVVVRGPAQLVPGKGFVRVLGDGLEQLTLGPALGDPYAHPPAPLQREELLVEVGIVGRVGHEDLAGDVTGLGVAVELLEEPPDELGPPDVFHLVDDEALAPDDPSLAHQEHLDRRLERVVDDADGVVVLFLGVDHLLAFDRLAHGHDLVAQAGRSFELERVAGFVHVLVEPIQRPARCRRRGTR